MATKQTSLRASKQAKRQKRSKEKQAAARKESANNKHLIGRRGMSKMMADAGGSESIAEQARLRLKSMKKRVRQGHMTQAEFNKQTAIEEEINNTVVMQNINDVIPAIIRVHSGIEVFIRLADEKRFEITPEQHVLIQTADQQITELTEDVNAIVAFVEDKKEPEQYMEIFMHYTELLAHLFEGTVPSIVEMLTVHQDLIDTYAKEHRNEETPMFEYMRGLHCERMEKVFPLYHTPVSATGGAAEALHAYTPENPMPSDPVIEVVAEEGEAQDPTLIDEDVSDAVLGEVPDLEQDVEDPVTPIA